MDLSARFKKDYLNYLAGIIIPAIINAASIPLFKRLLGSAGYGTFSITYNSVLLLAALFAGWIMQSVIRYFQSAENKYAFTSKALLISLKIQFISFVPILIATYYLKSDFQLSLLFSIALFIISIQFTIAAISQSVYLSRKNIFSEVIRTVSYIVIALIFLLGRFNYMYGLFIAIIISYTFSFLYLFTQSKKVLLNYPSSPGGSGTTHLLKDFLQYGIPLSLWFVFSYLTSIVDKYFMLYHYGKDIQGNYQAIFDFLSKSITVIISPVTISLFPLLTAAYQANKKYEMRKLMRSIISLEIAGLLITVGLYWWIGSKILFNLIDTPATFQYKLMGLLIIVGTFLWQIAIVVHKWYELKYKSKILLFMITTAFMSQLILYITFSYLNSLYLYPVGYVVSSVIYLLLVSARFAGQIKGRYLIEVFKFNTKNVRD